MLHHLDAAEAEEKDREMHSWTLNNFRYSLYDFSLGVLFNAFVVLCYFNIILVVIAYRQSYSFGLFGALFFSLCCFGGFLPIVDVVFSFSFSACFARCSSYCSQFDVGLLPVYFANNNKQNSALLRACVCMYLQQYKLPGWLTKRGCLKSVTVLSFGLYTCSNDGALTIAMLGILLYI